MFSFTSGSIVIIASAIDEIEYDFPVPRLPTIKTTCGLSNISFGLPLRGLMNQAFVVMLMTVGLDSALIDPLDKKMVSLVYAAKALLNKDEYCMDYITAAREEKLV